MTDRFWKDAAARAFAGELIRGEVVKVKRSPTQRVKRRHWVCWTVEDVQYVTDSRTVAVYAVRRTDPLTRETCGNRRGLCLVRGDEVLAYDPTADPFAGLP